MTSHPQDSNEKIALVSDVHGNLPAFRAVIEAIGQQGIDTVWCLGDLVGYGAQPDECVALARESCQLTLAGNHDLGVLGKIDISDFSQVAAEAALWTREHAQDETLEFLAGLTPQNGDEAIGLYHASPRDPVWEYVLSTSQAWYCMEAMPERVAAIGHSHVALRFTREGEDMTGEQVSAGTEFDMSAGDWLINPGSVGQPRDADPRAAWLVLDPAGWRATWMRTEYPIDEAAEAIRGAGLPEQLADRLYAGQ